MSAPRFDALPPALKELQFRPLFVMRLDVKPIEVVGQTAGALRRVGIVPSGSFAGERLNGVVLDGGSDWQTVRSDGSTTLDVRLLLRTDDGTRLLMSYRGVRHGEAGILQRLDRGEPVDSASYYFRINPVFEAPSGAYEWLNRVIAIGTGHRFPDGPVYSIFEVL
ncbi:DUF3237 domain-containing protein [Burkholderia sp. Ax-1719]|uniref:DUF3237 domain-containing protein n=1 Tax=Burkholderia sp. Ax-1719 TaxID=2608334 RepID=UPI001422D000|nr:DUF3237 domain-containing protein [Burkholderia sp. Ax-1719]NIE64276.1 DUF3237 domain-containing protein [Burkholderia sp. Ax-1719]